ncbi:OmpA family protein [Bradyrhizobium sp. RT3a]|uniref:OmpA family protein n=1 Tax=unclassified Bradyrhizobium TaxID=2631580 RepID=UPI00339478B9
MYIPADRFGTPVLSELAALGGRLEQKLDCIASARRSAAADVQLRLEKMTRLEEAHSGSVMPKVVHRLSDQISALAVRADCLPIVSVRSGQITKMSQLPEPFKALPLLDGMLGAPSQPIYLYSVFGNSSDRSGDTEFAQYTSEICRPVAEHPGRNCETLASLSSRKSVSSAEFVELLTQPADGTVVVPMSTKNVVGHTTSLGSDLLLVANGRLGDQITMGHEYALGFVLTANNRNVIAASIDEIEKDRLAGKSWEDVLKRFSADPQVLHLAAQKGMVTKTVPPVIRGIACTPSGDKTSVYFDIDSYDLNSSEREVIRRLTLNGIDNRLFVISGHADDPGAPYTNRALSQFRADAVAHQLVAGGVPPSRIRVVGMSNTCPQRKDAARRHISENRRASIRVLNVASWSDFKTPIDLVVR